MLQHMRFGITFDYLCPFARNANEAVLNGLDAGRDWEVDFVPFSLSQVHVGEGEPDVFADTEASGVLALHWGIAARDLDPGGFGRVHRALFAIRHDQRLDLGDGEVIHRAVSEAGVDADTLAKEVESGRPGETLAREHTEAVERWAVFGVPTFLYGDQATFARLMSRGVAEDVDRVLSLLDWSDLNEFKRTRLPR